MLTALGGSVATPPEGLTAEVVVVDNWSQLHALPAGAVKGKILLFNHPFDKELAATGHGLEAYGNSVVYRGAGPIAGAAAGSRRGAGAERGRSGFPAAAYGCDGVCAGERRRFRQRR